ncbi:hypothetical protein ABBQ38_010787 [Trebouxia sp. C0009 RCD-2024]
MAAPPPDYLNLANGMRETAQEFARVAQHPPLTLADLQQQLQQQLQQLQSQQLLQQIQDQLERSEARQQARVANSFALDDTVLHVIQNAAGAGPPHWPLQATPAHVRLMSAAHLNAILQFYQLPGGGSTAVKARKVLVYLGVRF